MATDMGRQLLPARLGEIYECHRERAFDIKVHVYRLGVSCKVVVGAGA